MDKFLIGYKRKISINEDTDARASKARENKKYASEQGSNTLKLRKYDVSYLSLGITSVLVNELKKNDKLIDLVIKKATLN